MNIINQRRMNAYKWVSCKPIIERRSSLENPSLNAAPGMLANIPSRHWVLNAQSTIGNSIFPVDPNSIVIPRVKFLGVREPTMQHIESGRHSESTNSAVDAVSLFITYPPNKIYSSVVPFLYPGGAESA